MRRALTFAAMLTALLILPAAAEVPDQLPDRDSKSTGTDNPAPKKSATKPSRKNMKLPGLVVNFQERCVDLEATVCLDEGRFVANPKLLGTWRTTIWRKP